jgi:fructose transport system substrate-binding protein
VAAVKAGQIGATSQQYPLKMAQEGVAAVAQFAKDGTKPEVTEGKTFVDTGVNLITDQPQIGVESQDPPSTETIVTSFCLPAAPTAA